MGDHLIFDEVGCYFLVFSNKILIDFALVLAHLHILEVCEFVLVDVEVLGRAFNLDQWIPLETFLGHEISIAFHDELGAAGEHHRNYQHVTRKNGHGSLIAQFKKECLIYYKCNYSTITSQSYFIIEYPESLR